MKFEVSAFRGSAGGIVEWKTQVDTTLTGNQVLIKVTHSGVCFTDVHYMQTDMVPGHEGAGIVVSIGPDGSFASHAIFKESFVFKIPHGLDPGDAAPLMCGGSTAWNGLHNAGVTPASRVGILGIGGLGHLAIQFAAKMGCEVVAFSRSRNKKLEALAMGAREYYALEGSTTGLSIGRPIDQLIVTTSLQPEWDKFIPIMAPGGVIVPLSIANDNLVIPYLPVVVRGIRIQGCIMLARQGHREMLDFAARNDIKPIRMDFPLNKEGVQSALALF